MKEYITAVVGATGLVGQEMVQTLERRGFPVKKLRPMATHRSAGSMIRFRGEEIPVEDVEKADFTGVDVALFAGGDDASVNYARRFVEKGALVVDNSKEFRMDSEVPLIVPEVNPSALRRHKGIIANPNCSTIQMVVALKPVYDAVGIERVVVSTYQAVSGTGKSALQELMEQSGDFMAGKEIRPKVYPYQIAFNLLPHIGSFTENGYSNEELKMLYETKKIMEDDRIRVSATTVRVPVMRGHSESVNITTREKISADEVRELMKKAPGIILMDDPAVNLYPYPLISAYRDEVFVGRIREDISQDRGIEMFVVSDNLLKGAATNAIQILEKMVEMKIL